MSAMMGLNDLEFRLLNDWQRGFPLVARPYAALAESLGCDEEAVLAGLASLKARGHVSRVGAVFRPHVLGFSTLAALACPPDRLETVARLVDGFPEVNHNYEREHVYNLWFVVAASSRERVAEVLAEIHRHSGLRPLDLPMVADYHIDLGFDLDTNERRKSRVVSPHLDTASGPRDVVALRGQLESADYALAAALEPGLELNPKPYAELARACGFDEETFLARLNRLLNLSVIRRFGVVVRHQELGYTANAMVVWDIPDDRVGQVGRQLAGQGAVTLCYQRPRRLPDWPYNLFSMVHGRDRDEVLEQVRQIRQALGLERVRCQPLFSQRRFKQCGARYSSLPKAA